MSQVIEFEGTLESMSYVKKMERWPKIKCHQLKKGGDWWELVVKLWLWCCHWEGEKNKPPPPRCPAKRPEQKPLCEMLTRNTSEEKLTVVKWEDGKWTGWKCRLWQVCFSEHAVDCGGDGSRDRGSYLMFIIFCLLISVVDLGPIKDRDGAFAPLMYGTY